MRILAILLGALLGLASSAAAQNEVPVDPWFEQYGCPQPPRWWSPIYERTQVGDNICAVMLRYGTPPWSSRTIESGGRQYVIWEVHEGGPTITFRWDGHQWLAWLVES